MKKSVFRDIDGENIPEENSEAPEQNPNSEAEESPELPKAAQTLNPDENKDLKDKYLRAVAELENFRKRALKEKSELIKYSGEYLSRDLLDIIDSFALAFTQNVEGVNEEFLKGFKMIFNQFNSVLEKHSIRAESSIGTQFDPNKHQALASVPNSEHAPGTIIEEFKKAYFIKDKLLRPAQVVVATAKADEESKEKE